jgi:hypothetical protein
MPALRPLRPSAPRALSAIAALAAIGSAALGGCASSLAQPFDQWKGASITVYRLQNYEPPPAQAGATFTIPPQIQSWIQGAAALLPPGLIPPGLIPGSAPAPAATAQDLRFHGFRVLQWKTVTDPKTHDEILSILGHASSFTAPGTVCPYDEFGFAIQPAPGSPTNDVLVSLSCEQVQAFNFQWPYSVAGLTPDTAKRIIAVAQTTFSP